VEYSSRTSSQNPKHDQDQLEPQLDVHVVFLNVEGGKIKSIWDICQQGFFRPLKRERLGRFPIAWTAAAELTGPPQFLAFLRESLDLVGIDDDRARSDLLGPDLTLPDHHPDVLLATSVQVCRLSRSAQSPLRLDSDCHLHGPGIDGLGGESRDAACLTAVATYTVPWRHVFQQKNVTPYSNGGDRTRENVVFPPPI
jgi:hypothetical protein